MAASADTDERVTVVDRVNKAARRLPPWPLYWLAALPPAGLLYLALTGGLGVEPVEVMEHRLGHWGLQLLIAGLLITPLRRYAGLNLIKYRRALGQIAFAYVALHLTVWLFLDVQVLSVFVSWADVWADIAKRPYITIGMAGFALLLPLAATSTDWAIKRMGPPAWRRLHKLTYAAVLLGGVHWVMLVRGWQLEPLLYLGAIVLVLGLRLRPERMVERIRARAAG